MIPYDNSPGIGWGPFKLAKDHPLFPAAEIHDANYDEIIQGTSKITLAEADKLFEDNCLCIAMMQEDPGDRERLRREAHMFYGVIRMWAFLIRPTLDAWKPGDPRP